MSKLLFFVRNLLLKTINKYLDFKFWRDRSLMTRVRTADCDLHTWAKVSKALSQKWVVCRRPWGAAEFFHLTLMKRNIISASTPSRYVRNLPTTYHSAEPICFFFPLVAISFPDRIDVWDRLCEHLEPCRTHDLCFGKSEHSFLPSAYTFDVGVFPLLLENNRPGLVVCQIKLMYCRCILCLQV